MWVDVVAEVDFPLGAKKLYATDFEDILILHLETGFYAIENRCSHDHIQMDEGCVEDGAWVCPFHGAHFCLRSGKALTPPAYEDIEVYAVRTASGMVQIDVDA
ncbi:MAG: Rieske 2Fe-2S domain-containing protein [Mariprofundaceae bacterium]|nr:Rieske 2Fe-2S domain-containing protein [Mariprofundaceae bacterium]